MIINSLKVKYSMENIILEVKYFAVKEFCNHNVCSQGLKNQY